MADLKNQHAQHRRRAASGDPDGAANRWLVLAIVLTAVFMQLLDVTITTVAVPSIQSSLRTTFGEVQLVLAGYSLAFA